jgi:hypothetical protein
MLRVARYSSFDYIRRFAKQFRQHGYLTVLLRRPGVDWAWFIILCCPAYVTHSKAIVPTNISVCRMHRVRLTRVAENKENASVATTRNNVALVVCIEWG